MTPGAPCRDHHVSATAGLWNGESNMRSENRNKRLVLLSLLAILAIGAIGTTGSALAEEPANFAEALAQAAAEDKVLIVDFYTDW
jgi:hypothetical protein